MLKNKASLYLLFPMVIIIWGIVIFRVLGAFGDEVVVLPPTSEKVGEEIKRIKKDTFSLLPIDQDPFLGHDYKKPVPIRAKSIIAAEPVEWPEISYLGLVSDAGQSSEIHILQINGRQLLVEKGGTADEIKVLNSRSGEVTLLYRGNRRTFPKNI